MRVGPDTRVWLSGASSGLGEALARELNRRGAQVALFARRAERLEALRDELTSTGGGKQVLIQAGDVQDRARVEEAVHEAQERFGGIDLLILNAGIGDSLFPDRFDVDLIERIFRTNLLGAVYAIGAALPGMLSRGTGMIVGVSSIAAIRGMPTAAPYCASKAALTTFLESLRGDLHGRGVRVLTVSPGFIKTPLTDRNRFPMPFIVSAESAARRVARGIERGSAHVHFPWRLTVPIRLLRLVPAGLFASVMGSFTARKGYRKRREGGA